MKVIINGESHSLPDSISTVKELLTHLKLTDRIVVVEVNRKILQKEDHESAPISDGDTLELVHFVGGG